MEKFLYAKYVNETTDANGVLTDISFNIPERFNFGFDVVDEMARLYPDKRAMIWLSSALEERIFTFRDMSDASNKTANYLMSLGVKKGDKVMITLKRHYEFWHVIVALHKIGAVAVPATHLLMKKDIEYRVNKARISAVIATPEDDFAAEVDKAAESCPDLKLKIMVREQKDGWLNYDAGVAAASPVLSRSSIEQTSVGDPMLMYFSSGTTGYPKCAVHDYSYPIGHIITARWWHNVRADGVHFTISDTGWGKAVWGKLYGQWLCGACVLTYDFHKFVPENILPLFERYNITTFCAPPTMYRFFIKEDLSKYNLSSLKYCTIAGEALNPEVYKQFYNATGISLMEGFGQTETTLTVANLVGNTPKPGSMGKPSPQYNVTLLGGDGGSVQTGEVGEIVINTAASKPCGLFMGYYDDEETTRGCWHDNVYHTGDMAWRDEDGYFWYVGRTDDLIKSSGYRIGPFEIESVLMELPCVLECAVTGVPDAVRGQVVKATIILAKGFVASPELTREIQSYVKKHTAPYKYPRVIDFVSELPKTISGKIMRKDVK